MAFLLRRASAKPHTARRWLSTSSERWPPLLVSPQHVHELIKNEPEKVTVLDATWFMPNSPRKGKTEFSAGKRLPGAQFLDLDEVASPHELGLKHMMPGPDVFAEACGRFGIESSTNVVIYDTHGVFSSPRALFMFRAFGHIRSSIIDGGLPRWVDEGFPLENGEPEQPRTTSYVKPELKDHFIRDYEQMVSNSLLDPTTNSRAGIVLDARPKERQVTELRFISSSSLSPPEPRPGLSSGHMPHSFSLPFNTFLQKQTSKVDGSEYTIFRDTNGLRHALDAAVGVEQAQAIIDGKRQVITTCGSGMTAGVLWLGLKLLRAKDVALYDESWTGYAMRPSSKIIQD
ncbi:putative 3-mercaptopyruvate sulfurtransferase [Leucoagaricus sp. SymC.cos]|nr:putative 3-mercaptopyruvate sulfurtransferase [Leucoagaricus sp. SymC.cos]